MNTRENRGPEPESSEKRKSLGENISQAKKSPSAGITNEASFFKNFSKQLKEKYGNMEQDKVIDITTLKEVKKKPTRRKAPKFYNSKRKSTSKPVKEKSTITKPNKSASTSTKKRAPISKKTSYSESESESDCSESSQYSSEDDNNSHSDSTFASVSSHENYRSRKSNKNYYSDENTARRNSKKANKTRKSNNYEKERRRSQDNKRPSSSDDESSEKSYKRRKDDRRSDHSDYRPSSLAMTPYAPHPPPAPPGYYGEGYNQYWRYPPHPSFGQNFPTPYYGYNPYYLPPPPPPHAGHSSHQPPYSSSMPPQPHAHNYSSYSHQQASELSSSNRQITREVYIQVDNSKQNLSTSVESGHPNNCVRALPSSSVAHWNNMESTAIVSNDSNRFARQDSILPSKSDRNLANPKEQAFLDLDHQKRLLKRNILDVTENEEIAETLWQFMSQMIPPNVDWSTVNHKVVILYDHLEVPYFNILISDPDSPLLDSRTFDKEILQLSDILFTFLRQKYSQESCQN